MQEKSIGGNNNTEKIDIQTFPSFYPFPWCYAHPSTVPLGPQIPGLTLGLVEVLGYHQHLQYFARRSMMLIYFSFSLQDLLGDHLYVFSDTIICVLFLIGLQVHHKSKFVLFYVGWIVALLLPPLKLLLSRSRSTFL